MFVYNIVKYIRKDDFCMKKYIALLLCLAALSMSACQTTVPPSDSVLTTPQTAATKETLCDLSEYKMILTGERIDRTITALAADLAGDIMSVTGKEIEVVKNGSESADDAKEIIVGQSTVGVDALTAAGYTDGIAIIKKGNKIYVYGTNNDALVVGFRRFIDDMVVYENGNALCSANGSTLADMTGNEFLRVGNRVFRTDLKSVVYEPTKTKPNVTLTYPKIVVLEHSGDNNGQILVTEESLDQDCYLVHRSTDGGKTWKITSRIRSGEKGMVANWQPFIYELPCDVGDMPVGTLLFAGCVRDEATSKLTQMVIWKSTDVGKSWEKIATVAEGGGIDAGLWEPVLYAENGKLHCFYSDETDKKNHSQMLVLKISEDGTNWGERIEVVACKQQSLRPGMLTLTKMGNGEYFIAYEIVGIDGNPIYSKTTKNLSDWSDSGDRGTPVATSTGLSFGSSPACAWTPAGGENGTLIVTAKHPVGGNSSTGTDWLVSFDYGKTWKNMDNPLPYTLTDAHRYAYSPGLFVTSDGSVYYVNDINCTTPGLENKASVTLAHIIIE